MNSTSQKTKQTGTSSFRTLWLNPRRKRFWVVVLFLLYTLLGFFLAPWVLKNSIVDFIKDDLGREASIEKVEVNPFVLNLKIIGFDLKDTDGTRIAAFDQFHTNLQLSSLFNRAWTFDEISLNGPYFLFERYTIEESRLSRLMADFPIPDNPKPAEEETRALPRLLIYNLAIRDGYGDLFDHVPSTPVQFPLGPINVEINDLNTLPDRDGNQDVSIALPGGATLSWKGSLSLAPLDSSGELVLHDSPLQHTIAYLKDAYPIDAISARLSARLNYRVQILDSGAPELEINDLQAELIELKASGLIPSEEFISVEKVAIEGGSLQFPEREVRLSRISIEEPRLSAWLDENGILSFNQFSSGSSDAEPATKPASEPAEPWNLMIDEVQLGSGQLDLADRRLDPAARVEVRKLDASIRQFSNSPGGEFPFNLSGDLNPAGNFGVEGQLSILPDLKLKATAKTTGIPLSVGQPYVAQLFRLRIDEGQLNTDVEFNLEGGSTFTVEGSLNVNDLAVTDIRDDTPLVGWKSLDIDRFDLNSGESSLHLSQVVIDELFGKLSIKKDRSTNLSGLALNTAEGEPVEESQASSFNLIIGQTGIRNGSLDFSDFSLPLPFATHISDLDGTFSTIATNSTEPANIHLEGQVDEFGLARINGAINMLDPIKHTNTSVEFRNLAVSDLTPYSVQFAGREIDEGKLDLDLSYVIREGQLEGQNDVVLSQLTLGKEVDSPDAANLPLGLAVALLKDSNGVINLNLPVAGDINDPEFKIGGVIWQAFSTLITKLVTAPFRLLGNLIGIDSEDLGQFQFLAGRSDLTPPELEKVTQLEQALGERPQLVIEVAGVFNPVVDTPALKMNSLRGIVTERLERDLIEEGDEFMMLDEEIRGVLEVLFAERNPEISLDAIKAEHMTVIGTDPEAAPKLDQLAYAVDLRDRLLDAEPVTAQDLTALGTARAETIRSAFLASGEFDESRISLVETIEVDSDNDEWVVTELGVATD